MQAQINPQLRKNIMLNRVKNIVHSIFNLLALSAHKVFAAAPTISIAPQQCAFFGKTLITVGLLGALGYGIYQHPPFQSVPQGSVGVRINQFTGSVSEWRNGNVLVIPGLYQMQVYSLRDQIYRPREIQSATGNAPLQSSEGLSFGVDLSVRYALDPLKITELAKTSPDDISKGLVESAVQGVIYKIFANYTMREIFSVKRVEIQQLIEKEVGASLARDGIVLRHVQIGNIDLPAEYRRGMESLLAEELATQKMRYTLELKEKQVKQSALEAEAEKARRETEAQAAASEQVIAAKAQEEAMKHVLPFKEKQIQQRQLEAEADKVARIRGAEGSAQARRIEAEGEADARQKLADAEVYRAEHMGKTNAEQMEREGALVTKHPLLIQKTLADKLSDKVQVIIASPPAGGGFIGANLLGASPASAARSNETAGAE
jgi:regulator of protease activity HflC (stomatin/prohibitin superfamily)